MGEYGGSCFCSAGGMVQREIVEEVSYETVVLKIHSITNDSLVEDE